MGIVFELTVKEAFSRQFTAFWNNGFADDLLAQALPQIEALAKAHYLEIANSGTAGKLDPRIGIETGAMFNELTTPIIQDNAIILETDLPYAMLQETNLEQSSGRSFLPSEDEVYAVFQKILADYS
jgi:hypothetical protein